MALNTNQQTSDDILDIKKQSLYARLKTLFSSDTIVRNVGGKKLIVKDVDHSQMATDRNSLRDRFNRIRSTAYNAYTRDFTLSYQAARMDLFRDYDCIAGETIIPLPNGTYPTIAELTEKYKDSPQERFHVFSYDHESDSMKLGNAYHPRKKEGKRVGWKVVFDDGKFVIGSEGHPFLMRNGEYKVIKDLRVGESVMPFYQSNYGYKKYGFKQYRKVYNFSKGWQTEHKIITEQFQRKLEKNEVIHHRDFNGSNNSVDNLQIMDWKEHKDFHSNHNKTVLWGPENYDTQLNKLKNNPNYINRKINTWDGKRAGENNPFYGKTHSEESNIRRSNSLKEAYKDRDWVADKNPNYRDDLDIDTLKVKAFEFYKSTGNIRIDTFSKYVKCDSSVIRNRMSNQNISWNTFKNEIVSKLNHKIVSIECVGEIDVYDVTVEKYQNFATDSVFCHNTMDQDPILSSALDIYSDECVTMNELGKIVTVHCEDNNIKEILYNLYEEILHVDFNLWSWTRNLVKYGDFYLKTYVNPEYGVYMVEPISTYNVERIENSDPYNKKYVKFQIRPTDTSQAEVLERYQMSHFRLLSDSNFIPYGKCVKYDTYIDTEFGTKQIKDVKVGDKVWSFNNDERKLELTSVINTINSGKKEILRIRSQHNFIDTSKNHPILTFNKITKTFEYTLAENVKIGDILVINSNKNKQNRPISINKQLTDSLTCPTFIPDIDNIPNIVDSEFANFFGFMLGDGWVKKYESGWRVCFALGIDEDQNNYYISLLEKYSGKRPTITKVGHEDGKSRTATVYTKRLAEILVNMGFGDGAHNKRIPEWAFELDEDLRLSLLEGFHNADGWNFEDEWANHYAIELCNKNLIYDLKRLVQFSNIKSSIPSIKDRTGQLSETLGMTIKQGISHYFYYYLDGKLKSQMEKYRFIGNEEVMLEPVKSIEDGGEEETYDIQVESSNHNFVANGIVVHNSVIEGARRVWKQLSLLEDSMMINRIVRAPERRIFYADVGGIPPAEVDNHMQRLMDKMKKVPYMDERTGEYNLKFNLQNMLDDFYIPVRGGDSGTKIDTLPGMEWTGIDDIDYLKNKMFAALKMPKAFLTFDESTGGKANLSQEDLRFARTIQRIQKIIGSELENIGIIHLYAQGYRDESLIDFKVELTNSSTIFEKEKLEIWSDKTALATDMIDNKIYNREWIYKNVFRMSDDDIEKVTKGLVEDAKQKFRLESIETEGDDPAKPFKKIGAGGHSGEKGSSSGGGHGGGGGGGMGGLGGLGGGDEEGEGEEGKSEDEKGESDKQGIPSEEPEATGGKPEDIVKEEHSPDRDQSGEHDANDHPFGEDPLGQNELNRKPRKNSEGKRKSVLYHNFENDSPLSLEEVKGQLKPKPSNKKNKGEFIMGLREFFDPTPSTIIAENIIDVTVSPTIDENVKSE
jgi:intein/homing endonuclease